jgi:hypothetical protein
VHRYYQLLTDVDNEPEDEKTTCCVAASGGKPMNGSEAAQTHAHGAALHRLYSSRQEQNLFRTTKHFSFNAIIKPDRKKKLFFNNVQRTVRSFKLRSGGIECIQQ